MRKEKQLLLDEIKEKIGAADAMIVVNYQHFEPTLSWDLSKQLSEKSSLFEIVKRRVFAKAVADMKLPLPSEEFKGHVGVVFIKGDLADATKTVCNFSEDNGDLFSIVAGTSEGKTYTEEEIKLLSKLPGKDQMRSELLGLFEAPMTRTLSVMEGLLTSLMYCLENKSKKEN